MKHTITFQLPAEHEELKDAQNGAAYRYALQELDDWLRSKVKYADLPVEVSQAYQETRDQLRSLLEEDNLVL